MRKMKAFIILILCMSLTTIATAENNTTANITTTETITQAVTPVVTQTTTQPVRPVVQTNQTAIQPNQTVVQPVQTTVQSVQTTVQPTQAAEKKFRTGPTVRIRPLNDLIKKDQDGMVEIYLDNPSLNDVTLTVDAHISVPSGIHVYGQGFGQAAAAGVVYGVFEVPPGSARTINVVIKAEKVGDFEAQFTGTYYPDGNKDAYQPISLTHPFKVTEASANPNDAGTAGNGAQTPVPPIAKAPGMTAILSIFVITILTYIMRKN